MLLPDRGIAIVALSNLFEEIQHSELLGQRPMGIERHPDTDAELDERTKRQRPAHGRQRTSRAKDPNRRRGAHSSEKRERNPGIPPGLLVLSKRQRAHAAFRTAT